MAKNFIPYPVRVSDDALQLLPATLRENLTAENILYAVKPDAGGETFVCDRPDCVGRVCTFLPTAQIEKLPKAGAKSPTVNVKVSTTHADASGTPSEAILAVTIPENLTDADVIGLVKNAATCVAEPKSGESDDLFMRIISHMNTYGPCAVSRMQTDIDVVI